MFTQKRVHLDDLTQIKTDVDDGDDVINGMEAVPAVVQNPPIRTTETPDWNAADAMRAIRAEVEMFHDLGLKCVWHELRTTLRVVFPEPALSEQHIQQFGAFIGAVRLSAAAVERRADCLLDLKPNADVVQALRQLRAIDHCW